MKNVLDFIKNKKWLLLSLILIVLIIIVDQYTKQWALHFISDIIEKTNGVHTHVKKTSFFNIVLVYNNGISFGIFSNLLFMKNVLFIIISGITAFLIYLLFKTKNNINLIAFAFIIGGAIGNLIDRAIYGAVIDFLDFHIKTLHWPAFNIADSAVCIGVVIYLINDFFLNKKNDIQ